MTIYAPRRRPERINRSTPASRPHFYAFNITAAGALRKRRLGAAPPGVVHHLGVAESCDEMLERYMIRIRARSSPARIADDTILRIGRIPNAMLITFRSDVGNITMFGDVAVTLLKLAGHSGTVPGAILGRDVPALLLRLKGALDALPAEEDRPSASADDEDAPAISLRKRAWALVELLERAARDEVDVSWSRDI